MKMVNKLFAISVLFFFISIFSISGCSKSKEVTPVSSADVEIHPAEWMTFGDPDFHANFVKSSGWTMGNCARCHGNDFAGGTSGQTCQTCHSATWSSCNTCHGNSAGADTDTLNWAPPTDLYGNSPETVQGVGAHNVHLTGTSLSDPIQCMECHLVPATFASPGHLDQSVGAEITYGTLATRPTLNVTPDPVYNPATATCSGTYCHGNFRNGNTNAEPRWTGGNNEVYCGSCHSIPPTTTANGGTHPLSPDIFDCYTCHSTVISSSGNLINKSLHINGVVNF